MRKVKGYLFPRIKILSASNGIVKDEEAAMEILESCGQRKLHPENDTLTVHSIIYNLTKKTVTWIGNEHYKEEDRIYKYSL